MKKTLLFTFIIGAITLGGCSLSSNNANNTTGKALTPEQTTNPVIENKAVTETKGVTINLSGQKLTKVPMSTFNQADTEILDLSNNQLTGALPSQIGNLKKLKVLIASNNLMTGVPAEVGQLSNLEILDLSNNQLTGLPNELGNLKNLKTMNLSGNNYSQQDLDYIKQRLTNTNFILK